MKLNKKLLYIIVPLIMIAGGSYYYISHKNNNSKSPSNQYDPTYFNPTEDIPKNDTAIGGGISNSKDSNDAMASGEPKKSVTPKKPIGTFVSNHKPNLSGSPAPNTESSTCSTTAGVLCEIRFSMNGVTKKLSAQKTNSYGNTTWNWTLQQVGLSEGTWKIQAVAINDSKTATTNDALDLVVSQ